MSDPSAGALLEARAQRLFLAQGSFAERGVLPTATTDRRMLATDIDVLVSEYVSGFHLTRRHVECKSGKFALLDRILWLNGVRNLLRADSSYLIATDVDLDATEFARGLEVELFTAKHLEAWEKSLGIPPDVWPCRSDYLTFDIAQSVWNKASDKDDEVWRFLRSALAFIEVESWLTFRYRVLNKLLRLLGEMPRFYDVNIQADRELCTRYVFSALLVRFAQCLLAVCEDASRVLPTEVEKYLIDRLTFGDQDPEQATDLTRATVEWVRRALTANGQKMPSQIDTTRLHTPPTYTAEFVQLVRRLMDQSQEARYLPLAVERMQFGLSTDDVLVRYKAAANSAEGLAVLIRAFIARTFKVPSKLTGPVRADLIAAYRTRSSTAGTAPISTKPDTTFSPRRHRQSSGRSSLQSDVAPRIGPGDLNLVDSSTDQENTEPQLKSPDATPQPDTEAKQPKEESSRQPPAAVSSQENSTE